MHNGCHQEYVFLSTEKLITDIKYIRHLMEEKCLSGAAFAFGSLKSDNVTRGRFINTFGHRIRPLFTKHSVDRSLSVEKDIVFALACKYSPY